MTRFGFFCPPAIGHLNPMCALALELQRRGHTVILFGVPDAVAKLANLNLTISEIGTFDYPKGSIDAAYRTLGKLTGKAGLEFTIDLFSEITKEVGNRSPSHSTFSGIRDQSRPKTRPTKREQPPRSLSLKQDSNPEFTNPIP